MSRPADWSPLAASDPVPGDQAEIQAVARRYRDFAAELGAQAATLNRLANDDGWDSDGARAFSSTASEVAGQLSKARGRYQSVGDALSTYATELAHAQQEADQALREAKQAEAEAEAKAAAAASAAPSAPGPTPSPSPSGTEVSDALQGPMQRMHRAVEQRDAAGRRAADTVRRAIDNDGLKDSWWDKVKDWSGKQWDSFTNWVHENAELFSTISEWAGNIGMVLGAIGAVLAVIPVVNVLAPAFLTLAAVATGVSLVFNLMLALSGDGSWWDVGMDVVGLATFGYGRMATSGARVGQKFLKVLGKQGALDGFAKAGAKNVDEAVAGIKAAGGTVSDRTRALLNEKMLAKAGQQADDAFNAIVKDKAPAFLEKMRPGLSRFADSRAGKILGMDSEVLLDPDKLKALGQLAPDSQMAKNTLAGIEANLKKIANADRVTTYADNFERALGAMGVEDKFKEALTFGRYAEK
ncbi:hypothetical protein LWF15_12285 [Kineosporia rhizophila]|uniref:WXG100 family type VII secretion target n=1 Tax=Kineosporia rhizophila TaxID=84633 RepID=UPI001E4DAD53|nr:hypothetical protein [Kineosporia rhizophila]MCE0536287.1 hypothetical protein [Kineosporia rhizophila]